MLGINRPSTGSRFVRFRRTRETMEPSDCDARRLENLWRFLIRLTQGARRHSHVVMHGNRDRQLGVWNITCHSRTASPNLSPSRNVALIKALTSLVAPKISQAVACLNAGEVASFPFPGDDRSSRT